ncbi:MAG: 4'-phosphopantetheinyl transferase family protein [Bacteroidota bacterium]
MIPKSDLIPLSHPDLPDSISLLASTRQPVHSGENRRRRERIDGDHLLHELLHLVGGEPPWSLERMDGCKPVASRNGVKAWLSLSHSPSLLAGAASLDLDLGIDLEPLQRTISKSLGTRILHPEESRWWDSGQSEDMLRLWTLKEAALKRCGTGLRTRMNRVRVEPVQPEKFEISLDSHSPMKALSWQDHDHWISLVWTVA